MKSNDKTYMAVVTEVMSGDDVQLLVDLGIDDLYKKVRARLKGVDTPDAFKAGHGTEAGNVRDMVKGMVKDKECTIILHRETKGGWIISLFQEDLRPTTCVNDLLIQEGHVFVKENLHVAP